MNGLTPNSYFLSQNTQELAEIITLYKDVASCYDNNLVLYLDQFTWEIFDTRRSLAVIRHSFKHIKALKNDLIRLRQDYINVGCAVFSRKETFTITEVASIKRLFKLYGNDTYFFKTQHLKDYIYDNFKEKNNYSNSVACN